MASQSQDEVLVALKTFLGKHDLQGHVSDIDEIVLNYVLGILEDLGDGNGSSEEMDVDEFIEMMDAYIPGFASIDSVAVCDWMFALAHQLSQTSSAEGEDSSKGDNPDVTDESGLSLAAHLGHSGAVPKSRSHLDSTGESSRNSSESSTDETDEQLESLLEMFPHTLRIEAEFCLKGSGGDVDRAVQLILHRQDTGEAITQDIQPKQKRSKAPVLDIEQADKERLMARYAYIDVDEDKKSYKPTAPKAEAKKLVRYLDNQVVNTKGNRFTEIKKDDTEEMKKTYINLKPAKKYRFH